jgi:hypothetical protein
MNCNLRIAMLSVGVLIFTLAAGQAEASSCSQADLAGRWSYTYTGTIFLSTPTGTVPLPLASVGHYRQDSAGNIHDGSQTRSVAGSAGVEEVSGTIILNDGCAATANLDALTGGVVQRKAVIATVYNQDENHFRAIFQSLVSADGTNLPVVITVEGEREHMEE